MQRKNFKIIMSACLVVSLIFGGNNVSAKSRMTSYNGITKIYDHSEKNSKISYKTDLNGDGKKEKITIKVTSFMEDEKTESYALNKKYQIIINGRIMDKRTVVGELRLVPSMEFYKVGKEKLLGVVDYGYNDWAWSIVIYRYNGNKLVRLDQKAKMKPNRGVSSVNGNTITTCHTTYPKRLTAKGKMKETYKTYRYRNHSLKLIKTRYKITDAAG